jgi:hypothetical protein
MLGEGYSEFSVVIFYFLMSLKLFQSENKSLLCLLNRQMMGQLETELGEAAGSVDHTESRA